MGEGTEARQGEGTVDDEEGKLLLRCNVNENVISNERRKRMSGVISQLVDCSCGMQETTHWILRKAWTRTTCC